MIKLEDIIQRKLSEIKTQLPGRAMEVANELRNTELKVNSGGRSGRRYGSHTASAPGEPPASWTGAFKNSWQAKVYTVGTSYTAAIESNHQFGRYHAATLLEGGTGKMAARPYREKVEEQTKDKAVKIYSKKYFK